MSLSPGTWDFTDVASEFSKISDEILRSFATKNAAFRFAPSPNGSLHLGHAYSALLNHVLAQRCGGRFLLRIEDIDRGRSRDVFVDGIFDDLAWLGLTWETPVLRQSSRFDVYARAISKLDALGVLYPCFATRGEITAAVGSQGDKGLCDPDGVPIYPGLFRGYPSADIDERKQAGQPFNLRLDVEKAVNLARARLGGKPLTFVEHDVVAGSRDKVVCVPERWGDVVLVRKDTPTSYHLSVVVDDAFQGVSHVVRGRDLFAATDLHRLLQVLLDLPAPVYHHHPLIADDAGLKLSKSEDAASLRSLREAGVRAHDVVAQLGLA